MEALLLKEKEDVSDTSLIYILDSSKLVLALIFLPFSKAYYLRTY